MTTFAGIADNAKYALRSQYGRWAIAFSALGLAGPLASCGDKGSDPTPQQTFITKPDIRTVETHVAKATGTIAEFAQIKDGDPIRGRVDALVMQGADMGGTLIPYFMPNSSPQVPDVYGTAKFEVDNITNVMSSDGTRRVVGQNLVVTFIRDQSRPDQANTGWSHTESINENNVRVVTNVRPDTMRYIIDNFELAATGAKTEQSVKKTFREAEQDYQGNTARLVGFGGLSTYKGARLLSGYVAK